MAELLKTWLDSTVYLGGQPIRVRLKALTFAEAPEFARAMQEIGKGEGDFFSRVKADFARDAFTRYLRLVEPITHEEAGRIESGSDLFKIATPGMVNAVLTRLERLMVLSVQEGKAFASPSMPEPARDSDDGDSPATSTEPAAGTTP